MEIKRQNNNPGLYLVATPIGNLKDFTFRSIDILNNSDYILCEDTRTTLKILNHYKIKKKLISFHKFNEKNKLSEVIDDLKKGKILSLVSDAGTPAISDPGAVLVSECHKNKINIFPIPGPSALTSAISASGFMGNFYFVGFLPKKESEIIDILNTLEKIKAVFIFYFPSRDLKKYNNYFAKFFNNCEFLLAREMSKIHEVYIRDKIKNLINFLDNNQKGEMTFLINNSDKTFDESTNIDNEIKLLIGKMKSKDISEYLSMKLNVSKKDIYNKVIKLND